MEKNRSVAAMRIVGGHLSLDLANTVECRHGRFGPDLLAAYGDLVEWAERVDLLDAEAAAHLCRRAAEVPEEADKALAQVKRLREAIYHVFSAIAAGAEPSPLDLEVIEGEARRAQAGRWLARTGRGYVWNWPDADLDTVVCRLAYEAADLLTASRLNRVKECFGRNCGWLFLDTSRNGLRRWCSEEACGTPARVTRHRAKAQRETPDAG